MVSSPAGKASYSAFAVVRTIIAAMARVVPSRGAGAGAEAVAAAAESAVMPPGSSATLAGRCLAGNFAGRGGAGGGGTLRAQLCHSLAAAFPAVAAHAGDLAERQL